jgi:hypothetical protein
VVTDSQLEDAAKLLVAERRMLKHATRRLYGLGTERRRLEARRAWGERAPEWQVESNAFVVTFLTHYRNLLDFLSPRKRLRKDAVTAGEFLGHDRTYRVDAPILYRRHIDQRLSHISWSRLKVSPEEKPWAYVTMYRELEASWQVFFSELRERFPERALWFGALPSDDSEVLRGSRAEVLFTGSATTSPTREPEVRLFESFPSPNDPEPE